MMKERKRRVASLLLAFALVFTSLVSTPPKEVSAATPIVSQAVADSVVNSGSGYLSFIGGYNFSFTIGGSTFTGTCQHPARLGPNDGSYTYSVSKTVGTDYDTYYVYVNSDYAAPYAAGSFNTAFNSDLQAAIVTVMMNHAIWGVAGAVGGGTSVPVAEQKARVAAHVTANYPEVLAAYEGSAESFVDAIWDGGTPTFSAQAVAFSFMVEKLGYVQIEKASSNPVEIRGNNNYNLVATFDITGPNGYHKVVKTDANGGFKSEGLKPGNYTVKETVTCNGHVIMSTAPVTKSVEAGQTVKWSFTNRALLDPIQIHVKKEFTDNNKDARINDTLDGTVFRVEFYGQKAKPGNGAAADGIWEMKTSGMGTGTNGQFAKPYSTAVFGDANTSVVKAPAGTNGYYSQKWFPLGWIKVYEKTAAKGYEKNSGKTAVNGEETDNNVLWYHVEQNGTVTKVTVNGKNGLLVVKTDKPVEENKNNDANVYQLEVNKIDKTTGKQSEQLGDLPDIKYEGMTVKIRTEQWVKFDADQNGVIDADEEFQKGDFIPYMDNVEIAVPKNGKWTSPKDWLPYGKYTVTEIKEPTGYLKDAPDVLVDFTTKENHSKVNIEFKNTEKHINVEVFKMKSDGTGSSFGAPEKGAEFTIVLRRDLEAQIGVQNEYTNEDVLKVYNTLKADPNRNKYDLKEFAQIVTGDDGKASFNNLVGYADYYIANTKTGDGESAPIKMARFFSGKEQENNYTFKFTTNNSPKEYYLELVKKDLGTDKTVTLNSAAFKITKIEDAAGNEVNEPITMKVARDKYSWFETNSDNPTPPLLQTPATYHNPKDDKGAVMTPLKLTAGKYKIEEMKTPFGFVTTDSITVTIANGEITEVDADDDEIIKRSYPNEQAYGEITIEKAMKDTDSKVLPEVKEEFKKVEVTIYAGEDIYSPIDGSLVYEKDQEVEKKNLDENGNCTFEKLPVGIDPNGAKYYVKETAVPTTMVPNTKKFERTVKYQGPTVPVIKLDLGIENNWTETELHKTDLVTGEELEGATVQILDGTTVIDEWVSTKEPHKIAGLERGKTYTFHETLAPDKYGLANDVKFTVREDGKVTKVELKDEPVNIKTTARDGVTDDHQGSNDSETLIDKVEYRQLTIGKEYTVKGTLMDKKTGEPLLVKGKKVTAEKTFTATKKNGYVELTFTFPKKALEGKTTVVFEKLFRDNKEVAVHEDIKDEGQTVEYPKIGTTAKDRVDGDKFLEAGKKVEVVDTVKYENLIPGKTYKVEGKLVDKEDANKVVATATKEFTAKKAKGTVDIVFEFDATSLSSTKIVAFEKVFYKDKLIAAHEDLNDEGQTVEFGENPNTGDMNNFIYLGVFGSALAGLGGLFAFRRRRVAKDAE